MRWFAGLFIGSLLLPTSLGGQDPDHVMELVSTVAVAGETVEVPLLFDNALPLAGYQATVAHNPDQLTILDVLSAEITIDLSPEFLQVSLYPNGFNLVVAYMQGGLGHLPIGTQQEVHSIVYQVEAGMSPGSSPVGFSTDIGNPPWPSSMWDWLTGALIVPTLLDGSVDVDVGMIRGDVNLDATIDISDAIHLAQWLFQQGEAILCADATDSNDDGTIDMADVVTIVNYLFLTSGGTISGNCEVDSTIDSLDCTMPNCP